MNLTPWILFTIAFLLLIPHRKIKPKDEFFQIFKFVKYAPTLFVCIILIFVFIFCWGESQSLKNARLTGELFLGSTNMPTMLLDSDYRTLIKRTAEFARSFSRTNSNKPKLTLLLCQNAKQSKFLLRQIKDASKNSGWEVTMHDSHGQIPPNNGIWVYVKDIWHPLEQYGFWQKTLTECNLDVQAGVWTGAIAYGQTIGDDETIILVNDPNYFPRQNDHR
jgi:hypothetical protein